MISQYLNDNNIKKIYSDFNIFFPLRLIFWILLTRTKIFERKQQKNIEVNLQYKGNI